MNGLILLFLIILPLLAGLVVIAIPNKIKWLKEGISLLAVLVNIIFAFAFFKSEGSLVLPWCGLGLEFSLRLYQFSAFILGAAASFGLLVTLYSVVFMSNREKLNQYYGYILITLAMANGAVLANNLILLLFFWEGLLLTIFGLIAIGSPNAFKTAIKAFIIIGITDLCLLFGIALTAHLAGTLTLTKISLSLNGLGNVAFVFLMIGAIAKAGSMPFHSWIPDAAIDAPLPFMALFPAAIEKLLGIYFLSRLTLDLFKLTPASWISPLLMTIGGVTIILAVMMALIQKDFKRLLSYHAISQVGYMILGIGTAVPVGIVGGIFHMLNNALYKSCLFMAGGSVEKQTGTTDLTKLGGLAWKMPITFGCFIIAAAAISGVPPFNGFFSKELIYDGALERGWVFYAIAVLGSFFTAASFLKLGHATFLGQGGQETKNVKEVNWLMYLPMLVLAGVCILFGVFNSLPLNNLIQPILGEHRLEGHNYAGLPTNIYLVIGTLIVLCLALLNHFYGVKKSRSGVGASEHIHHAPVLGSIYDKAEQKWFDPYDLGKIVANWFSHVLFFIDRAVDWFYEVLVVRATEILSALIRRAHNGDFSFYAGWSLAGAIIILFYILRF